MKNLVAILFALVLVGCGATSGRPDQDNFTIHATQQQAQTFVDSLSKRFGSVPDEYELSGPGNDPSRMYRLDGAHAILIIMPLADRRCDINAPRHSTFHEGEYRVDLVYRSLPSAEREAARRELVQSAQDAGLAITEYQECP